MHIGSGPGVAGLSAMQVKPLSPRRIVRIDPSRPTATIVAPRATAAGAADMALRISAALGLAAARRPVWLQPAAESRAALVASSARVLNRGMACLLLSTRKTGRAG